MNTPRFIGYSVFHFGAAALWVFACLEVSSGRFASTVASMCWLISMLFREPLPREKQNAKRVLLTIIVVVALAAVVVYAAYLLSKIDGGRLVLAAAIALVGAWAWAIEAKKWKRA